MASRSDWTHPAPCRESRVKEFLPPIPFVGILSAGAYGAYHMASWIWSPLILVVGLFAGIIVGAGLSTGLGLKEGPPGIH